MIHRIRLRVHDDELEALRRLCAENGESYTQVLRRLIRQAAEPAEGPVKRFAGMGRYIAARKLR